MSLNPAICFNIVDRGYLDERKYADLVLVDVIATWTVQKKNNVVYKCGWSPLEGKSFQRQVNSTFVHGIKAFTHVEELLKGSGKRYKFL